jgi:hypothetical protein
VGVDRVVAIDQLFKPPLHWKVNQLLIHSVQGCLWWSETPYIHAAFQPVEEGQTSTQTPSCCCHAGFLYRQYLKSIPLFSNLEPAFLSAVSARMRRLCSNPTLQLHQHRRPLSPFLTCIDCLRLNAGITTYTPKEIIFR